jgi:colanic acid biosynthesis glycosyl transferase WcaI
MWSLELNGVGCAAEAVGQRAMPPLHIAFFNRSYYPDTTATGQLLTELCEGLVQEHRCRVSVVTGMAAAGEGEVGRGMVGGPEMRHGVEILRSWGTRYSKQRFAGRLSNYVTYFLSATLAGFRLDRPDVIVALTDPPIIGLAAYAMARRFRVPFVMSYQDIFPEVARLLEGFQSEIINRMLQNINCFLARKATKNIVLGETMRRRLVDGKGADPASTVVIPNWADGSKISPGPKRNPFSERHGLTNKFVVMHSGNIGLSQDLGMVVEAAALVRGTPEIEIVVIGDGVEKPRLMRQAETLNLRNMRFLPFEPKDRLNESFASADIFVVSLKKGLAGYIVPSKLYGILAAGRPYIAAVEDESEVAEVTRKYDCGLLTEPGNAQDLARKIGFLHQDRELVRRMGERARRASLEFDRIVQVRSYYTLFRELAGG